MKKAMIAVACALALVGCASKFETHKFDTKTWTPSKESVEGVIYYEPHQVVITYKYTMLVDKDKNVIGTSEDKACVEVIQKQELAIEPDFESARVLINNPSNFSSSKFSVALNNGMLASVNSESTPKATELIKEVTGFAKEAGFFPLAGNNAPACNAGPVIREKKPWQN
ncbi:hypothetical protein [Candidatus Nitrotoga sp. AM1P]|uniref:hypothetical protein n=1 Tax=Candidatus Nitrotoga sp. AM1P TaxID=2559597 RepID=UPI0010B199E8|nr:hypothetical protein [Candidatus Nitrotoga sp. AM1P]BBJ24325.1 hypothetical protein W01_22520 [Candidatus Nitrotoga sp. AM1P]